MKIKWISKVLKFRFWKMALQRPSYKNMIFYKKFVFQNCWVLCDFNKYNSTGRKKGIGNDKEYASKLKIFNTHIL